MYRKYNIKNKKKLILLEIYHPSLSFLPSISTSSKNLNCVSYKKHINFVRLTFDYIISSL